MVFYSFLNKFNDIIICVYWFELFSQVSDMAHGPLVFVRGFSSHSRILHLWKETRDIYTCCRAFLQWSCHYLLKRQRSVDAWIRTSNVLHARRTLKPTASLPRSFLCLTDVRWYCVYLYLNINCSAFYSGKWCTYFFSS